MSQGARTRSDLGVVTGAATKYEPLTIVLPPGARLTPHQLPADVIAPVTPPPVTTLGSALGKARSFFRRFLAGMRG